MLDGRAKRSSSSARELVNPLADQPLVDSQLRADEQVLEHRAALAVERERPAPEAVPHAR